MPGLPRRGDERREFWMILAAAIVKSLVFGLTRRRWSGRERIPRTGGVIVAVNHLSEVDPFVVAHYVHSAGRAPRFMVKRSLLSLPVGGRILRGCRQIPVDRDTTAAGDSLRDARAALEDGGCVVIYPEGTTTKDPDYWPMLAKTGAARLALETGVPVVPVTHWGAQEIFGRDKKLRPFPRKLVVMASGGPVDLSAYAGRPVTAEVLRAATARIMDVFRVEEGHIRAESPPAEVWDPKASAYVHPADQELGR